MTRDPGRTKTSATEQRGTTSLTVISSDGAMRTHALPASGKMTIGRATDCTVVIDDESLSRYHAALWVFGDEIAIEDLGSRNGTHVGDTKLEPRERRRVRFGEVIAAGDATLLLRRVLDAAERASGKSHAGSETVVRGTLGELTPALRRIAASGINVIVMGETGVGKDVIARALHDLSPRAEQPLVSINCAAFSETLLEGELFGHERGAFTGAHAEKIGLLESAHGGSVFLDEIGEMPLASQVKLLRVVETKQVQRVGAVRPRTIDVRFLAATHRDLDAEVAAGRFREDLLFRLNGISLVVLPLRERVHEIELLAELFLAQAAAREKLTVPPRLPEDTRALLRSYRWPGNVRELRNVIERAMVLSADGIIKPSDLPLEKMRTKPVDLDAPGRAARAGAEPDAQRLDRRAPAARSASRDDERARIVAALEAADGNQQDAAKALGISRRTLIYRMEEFDLPRPRKR